MLNRCKGGATSFRIASQKFGGFYKARQSNCTTLVVVQACLEFHLFRKILELAAEFGSQMSSLPRRTTLGF